MSRKMSDDAYALVKQITRRFIRPRAYNCIMNGLANEDIEGEITIEEIRNWLMESNELKTMPNIGKVTVQELLRVFNVRVRICPYCKQKLPNDD